MQRCANCGADLPDDARFCGNCGAVPSQPQPNPWSQPQPSMPQQSGGWPQPAPVQQQPSQVGGWPQSNPVQQPSQMGGWPQPTPVQQPSQAGWPQPAPVQQQPSQAEWQQYQAPSQPGGWPQSPSEQFYAQSQSAPPAQFPPSPSMPQIPPGGGWQQQQQPPFMPPPGGPPTPNKRSTFPRWIFIALIAVLLIGGSVTAFALLNRHANQPATGTGTGTPGTHTVPTSAPTQTAAATSTPVLAGGSPLATPTVLADCPGGFSRTGSFSFSGSVSGQMTVARFAACGPVTVAENGIQVKEYVGVAMGTIGAKAYEFLFGAFPYNNPGTYQSIEVIGRLTDTGTNQAWQDILAAAPGTITVNADGKSGSLSITMPQSEPTIDSNNTVKVTGSWSS
ncbi:MAG TPA: zinc-ribbon domain-containing protein [Ktedonobacteraceae bacterium]|nr:zinc-ribbon domain-containing protein [Ktedonobacteraceae bacterium]